MAQLVKNMSGMQETWVRSLHWEDPLEKGKATHPSILAWRQLNWTQLSDFLEKAMAPHPSTLAWKIPGTGEPGGLPSMGSHRVVHD